MTEHSEVERSDTGPFALTPEWVLFAPGLSDRAKTLYAVLGRYADREGKAWPSRRTLSVRMECSTKSIDRALDELKVLGALRVRAQADSRGQTTNLYTIMRVSAPLPTGGDGPLDTDVAQNESHVEREPYSSPTSNEVVSREGYDPARGTKIEGRNLPWDALVEATQADERVEKGRIASALRTIRSVAGEGLSTDDPALAEGYIASEIRVRARLYRDRWPNVELTPTALAANWSRVMNPQPGRDVDSALAAAQEGIEAAGMRSDV